MTFTETPPASAVGTGRSCGKAILLGEHTVVYGLPAIAVPLPDLPVTATACSPNTRPIVDDPAQQGDAHGDATTVRFTYRPGAAAEADSGAAAAVRAALRRWGSGSADVEVTVRSAIPPARGLGSSAACAVAAVRAVADLHARSLDHATLHELAQCGERLVHGRASGVDAAAVATTGPILFHAGDVRPLITGTAATLVVADSGEPGDTRQAVDSVWTTLHRERANAQRLLARAGEIIDAATVDLTAGRTAALGMRLIEFQALLRELGVSTSSLDRLIATALRAGAHGAKLTGGGFGGCMVALTEPDAAPAVCRELRAAGACRTWTVPMWGW
ncbi:mevalonate kinase [Nocardia sp. BMG51109]|uniref:mevalonate kinase n=1 Tax=Nocardia sp. BMG51109 TaxID=1056816 RepID=UPI0004664F56|nr:mevalonate kinase [Nocardia sp. BMG51109]